MKEDMLVKARYKDSPEDEWFEVLLTDDRKMYDKKTGQEITRTDLQFKADDNAEIIDMEEEWDNYKMEKLRDTLHWQASFLMAQIKHNQEKYEKE